MTLKRRTFLQAAAAACCQGLLFPGSAAFGAKPEDAIEGKEALFYEKLDNRVVRCQTCPHSCVIPLHARGRCRTKINRDGSLYTLSWANPCTINVDPVEKKPLLHFLPGTTTFSLAVAGCNFSCLNCQNWEISQTSPDKTRNYSLPPRAAVATALRHNCPSISYTYSEPVSFYEYMLDIAAKAKEQGIKNVWVSNAYIQPKALHRLCDYIDAASLNLKSFSDDTYRTLNGGRLAPVLETLKIVRERGVWLELINLVIPGYTDDMDEIARMCDWILENLGPDTPLSFSRFFPRYRLTNLPATPLEVLDRARERALNQGLFHVYIGNVPGKTDDVICANCKAPVLRRRGYQLLENRIVFGACPDCGRPVAGRWA